MGKKSIRLGRSDAVARLDAMIELIYRDVGVAIEVEAALNAGNAIVCKELPNAQYDAAQCYNVISKSSALFLALTLAKLFEIPTPRGKRAAYKHLTLGQALQTWGSPEWQTDYPQGAPKELEPFAGRLDQGLINDDVLRAFLMDDETAPGDQDLATLVSPNRLRVDAPRRRDLLRWRWSAA